MLRRLNLVIGNAHVCCAESATIPGNCQGDRYASPRWNICFSGQSENEDPSLLSFIYSDSFHLTNATDGVETTGSFDDNYE